MNRLNTVTVCTQKTILLEKLYKVKLNNPKNGIFLTKTAKKSRCHIKRSETGVFPVPLPVKRSILNQIICRCTAGS